jgi:hypothetical protein
MPEAPTVDESLRIRLADPLPLPDAGPSECPYLRNSEVPCETCRITSGPTAGELTIQRPGIKNLLERLVLLAKVLENDFDTIAVLIQVPTTRRR